MALAALPVDRYDTEDGLPEGRGCVALVAALWKQAHEDLRYTTNTHCLKTVRWVESADFDRWCGISGADPKAARANFMDEYPRSFALFGRKAADVPADAATAE